MQSSIVRKSSLRIVRSGIPVFLLSAGLAGPLSAAEEPAAPEGPAGEAPGVTVRDSGNRVVYTPEYFSQYNVITASDQLERIPGIQDLLGGGPPGQGGDQRGFGSSGDQILINGRRVSGKSNDVDSVLERIQARQVVRVEVIRGTVPDLDVRSQGRVVNVVLDDALTTGYGSWQGEVQSYSDGRYGGGGEMSYSGDLGALSYLFSLEADSRKGSTERTDRFFTPGDQLFERHAETTRSDSRDYELSTNTSYTFSNGDILNLNGLYAREDENENEDSVRFGVSPQQETFLSNVRIAEQDESSNWEVGGDYEHIFANGSALAARFVYTSESGDDRRSFFSTPADGETVLENVQEGSSESTEQIVRSTYSWDMGQEHSFESGAEIAINTVDESSQLFRNSNGTLEETPLFNQESEIEENRYEAFTTYTWQARPDLLVESSLDLEYSEITQQGEDVSRSRDFFFTRPRLVVRYDQNDQSQWRGRIERSVDQLDFGSFVASFTNDNNRFDVISAGNPELVPEKSWDFELTWERRLADDMGLVSVSGEYSDVEDRESRIPLVVRNQDGELVERTAPGNIGDGRFMQLELSGSLRLGWLDLRGAVIDASIAWEESNVTDPFTGEEREFDFTPEYRWSLGFRHDTNWNNLSYGMEARNFGPVETFDRDFRQTQEQDLDMELFAEIQAFEDLTFRLSVQELLRAEQQRERFQFVGNRGDGILERREFRTSRSSREIAFSIQGVF